MTADQIKLVGVRLSFPDLFKAKAVQEGGEAKFGAAFLLDKIRDAEQIKNLQKAIIAVAKEKFGGADEVRKLRDKGKLTFCLHEGSEKDYDGYTDAIMYISTSSKQRPIILDRNLSQLVEADGRPYAGCYVDAIIRIWVQDNQFGKKVNAELRGVQFVKDGEPFGVAPLDPNEFTDYSEGEESSSAETTTAAPPAKKAAAKKTEASDEEIEF